MSAPRPEHVRLPLDRIDVPRARIRKDLGQIEELAVSLDSFGLLHPVHVYASHGRYRLVAGERRLEAAKKLGWTSIDAMIREASENDLLASNGPAAPENWFAPIWKPADLGCEI